MHKVVQQQKKAMDTVPGKHHKLMEFATNSSPVQSTVALTSQLPDTPVELSLLETLPVPSFKTIKEYNEDQRKHCTRSRKAKKAKKDSVHLSAAELPHGRMLGNVQVFPEVSSNPIDKTGKLLFLEENQKVFPNSPSIINPKHLCARYFKALIESLNLDDDEGYLNDPSLDMNHCTDYKSQVNYEDEPPNWGTPSAQDYESSSDDSIGNELAMMAGISCLLLAPDLSQRLSTAPSNRSSKGMGKQREWALFNTNDQDNNLDSHAYNYGYNRSVSTNSPVCSLSDDVRVSPVALRFGSEMDPC